MHAHVVVEPVWEARAGRVHDRLYAVALHHLDEDGQVADVPVLHRDVACVPAHVVRPRHQIVEDGLVSCFLEVACDAAPDETGASYACLRC